MLMPRLAAPLRGLLTCCLVCLALGGCSLPGGASPTATPPPTATAAPIAATPPPVAAAAPSIIPSSPTATATVTVAPTATRILAPGTPATPATPSARPATPGTPGTPAATGRILTDEKGTCELILPPELVGRVGRNMSDKPNTFMLDRGPLLITVQSLDVGPDETLDDLALPFVGAFIPTVTNYEQTAVIRLADSLRIDYRGSRPSPGGGVLHFQQFGPTICVVTLFVADVMGISVDSLAEQLIATLRPKGVG